MTQLTAQEQNLLAQITSAVRQVVREELEAAKPVEQPVVTVTATNTTPVVAEEPVAVVAEQPAKPAEQPVVAEEQTAKPPKWYEKKKAKK